jgi:hypothetical protein
MKKSNIGVVAMLGAGLIMGSLTAQAGEDALLERYRMFRLDSGDIKPVIRRNNIKAYRVCMDDGQHAVPLKVMHDGRETIVEPGECQLIEGQKIKLASASPLHAGMTLIGRFQNGSSDSRKKYITDVSVAQATER